MKILVDANGEFSDLEEKITEMVSNGYKNIMVFHAEGGIDSDSNYKERSDNVLVSQHENNVQIFGGIFPGIFDNGILMTKGSILAGIKSEVHVITLENLNDPNIHNTVEQELEPIKKELESNEFKTLFVFGDGFGENNLRLINVLNRLVKKHPVNVIGGLTGRDKVKASLYSIFTPTKIIQNGAVLAFTKLKSGIGVKHGWEPLMDSALEVTKTNGCFIEEINGTSAFDFYMHVITSFDEKLDSIQDELIKDADKFFNIVAVKYPLGLIREKQGGKNYIDRTAVSVGGDKSLQFSSEIPVGTKACILHLKGNSPDEQCNNLTAAIRTAFKESKNNFPDHIKNRRVIIMDCFGRKKTVEYMGKEYSDIEFTEIALDQKDKSHSPIGPLTFGEISSMEGNYVELHNKTAVVGIIEDD